MKPTSRIPYLQQLSAFALTLTLSTPGHGGLHYTCEDLADMAARFAGLKIEGYELDEILAVIQKSSINQPEKEALLSNMAIELYIDRSIETTDQARSLAFGHCGRK